MVSMERIGKLCEDTKRLVIYGAGTVSNILYLYLKSKGLSEKIQCFAVTKRENNPYYKYGLEVLEAEDAVQLYRDALVLVGVQNILSEAIREYLTALQYENYEFIDVESLIHIFYDRLYRSPIQKNKIIFSNMKDMGYGGNPKYIAEELLKSDLEKRLDLVWVVSQQKYSFPKGIRTVETGTFEYYYELATAHMWVDNTRKNFDARKRRGQYYIQTWHGAAPIKKVEKDAEGSLPKSYVANAKKDSEMADVFLSGSKFYTELYRKSFWYDGPILKVGLPRHDVFWKGEVIRRKVFQHFGLMEEKCMVLYAPTFRKDFTNQYYDIDFTAVLSALTKRFGREFVLAVSKHPDNRYLEYDFAQKDFIAVDRYDDFEELLKAADVLISDYSGCMYDFSYTRRPVFLYQRDYESYKEDRDFYVPMEELPYIKAYSNEELVRRIEEFDMAAYQKRLDTFMDGMGNYDDGTASKKVSKYIWGILDKMTLSISEENANAESIMFALSQDSSCER
ncbi:hypothetical protein GN277_06260 [Lachnospiraceae bacterium WCA-9-b2]|uniref:CDP-glycerol:poly(Glycerophosphate) glycerophosphotransferase n=1 Tax=Sporofaciens musculi TaxID=2681861 RepID=A0A7X3SIC1_9FIRM|nr:hypothetical protein [Sporofaciens musculi]